MAPDLQTAQEQLRKKNQDLADMYREKCKKFTQITHLYNLLKSRAMRSQMQNAAASQAFNDLEISRNGPTSLVAQTHSAQAPPQTPSAFQQMTNPVDIDGVEQLHRHQRSGTGSSKGTKKKSILTAMAPPSRPSIGMRRGMSIIFILCGYTNAV